MTPTDSAEKVVAELRDVLTDWDGADLPDAELPRVDVLCGTLRRAAALIESQRAELAEVRKTEDWLRNEISRIRSMHLKPEAHVAPSLEAIQSAIRETEYKYFGDYELSEEQWDAVITLIYAAKHLAAERIARDAAEARVTALEAEKAERNEALDGVYTYCNDTLSGRVDGGPDDRGWQREAVIRARNLARPFARPEIEAAIRAQALSPSTEVKNDER